MNSQQHLFLSMFPEGYKGYAIDVGANDGVFLSNTDELERRGWEVLCIEPNPLYAPRLWQARKNTLCCAVGATQTRAEFFVYSFGGNEFASDSGLIERGAPSFKYPVCVETLDSLIAHWEPPHLDLLTIDVEGTEGDVLRGIDLARWAPLIVCVEDRQNAHTHAPYLAPFGYHFHLNFDVDEVYTL